MGWQRQAHGATVQGAIERAILAVTGEAAVVHAAGRTDAGVHAVGQVIHFDSEALRSPRSWLLGTNSALPRDAVVRWVLPVDGDFHARFSAVRRSYRYVIYNATCRSALYRDRSAWQHRPLDVDTMNRAAGGLLGEHDFSSYRAQACQAKSPVRTVYRLRVARRGDYVIIDIEANAFLHHMVRNIAGVLMAIGSGERPAGWAADVLGYRDRALGGVTAPPQGLYLMSVAYSDGHGIPPVTCEGAFPWEACPGT